MIDVVTFDDRQLLSDDAHPKLFAAYEYLEKRRREAVEMLRLRE